MQKITSNILIVATVIAMLPIQGFALDEQTVMTNTTKTEGSQSIINNTGSGFTNNTDRINFIKNKLKGVNKKNLSDSINEKDPNIRAKKVNTLVEGFHDRKKNKKEVIITSNNSLESIRIYLKNIDDSTSVKAIGNNMYSVTFQNGKNLDTSYFQDINNGLVPEKLFDYPIVQPVLVTVDAATTSPYLAGESISNLWGMTKMETTNYQSGLSLQLNHVTVAIIDTGIDRTHKDLAKNTWVNSKEIVGNGIDDDGNGYVDDINGYDFVNNDSDPLDDHGHGTHVSGTTAGVVNGAGVFGVNSSAKIVGLKVLAASGQGSTYAVYKAIYYAADNGIKVINMSLGGAGSPLNDPICAAINYAKTKGTITVVAAGNSNVDASTQIPAGCPNAITVGAVDSTLKKAYFSNYGTKTDVAAPGVNIYSSTRGNTYGSWAGTSMASPHIAGLVSAIKTYKPNLTVDDIKTIFKDVNLTEPVTSTVNIGRFPNMTKIFTNLGIKSDSEITTPVTPPPADIIPPVTTVTPSVSLTTQTGTTLSVAISEDGTGYYLALPATTAAPSNTSVVAGNNSFAMRSLTTTSVKVGGLTASTAYKIWFVAKDNIGNLQATVSSIAFTTLAIPSGDITPPTNITPPSVSLITQTGTVFSVSINENGTGYHLTLPATAVAPSIDSVIKSGTSIAMRAQSPISVKIGGLSANTAYKIWFVAKDLAGNLQRTVGSVAFTTLAVPVVNPPKDTTPPVTTVAPSASLITQTGTTLSVAINEVGTGYYLVLPAATAAPSNTTVMAGNKYLALKANTTTSVKIGGLSANTAYKIWFVAKDLAGNLQRTVGSVAFTTLAVPVVNPKPNIPPTITYTSRLIRKNTYELTAVGTDTDGTIKGYEMYVNGYVFTRQNKVTVSIGGGNITVSAKVYDNLGASATSQNIILQYVR